MSPIKWHLPIRGEEHTPETITIKTGIQFEEILLRYKCVTTAFNENKACKPMVIGIHDLNFVVDIQVDKPTGRLTFQNVKTQSAEFSLEGATSQQAVRPLVVVNNEDAHSDLRHELNEYIYDLVYQSEVRFPAPVLNECLV